MFTFEREEVADYFVRKRTNPDYRPTVDELLKLLSVLTQDERFVLSLTEEGGRPENMCEVLDRAEARGVARGKAEGRTEGRAEGIKQSRLESIRNVMEGLRYTAQQAMDLLKIPAAEQGKYLSRL